MQKLRTRYELESAISQEVGISLAGIIGKLTGKARHEDRIRRAKEVLFEDLKESDPQDCVVARYRRDLELAGVGGRGDFMGSSTERMPYFRSLGKGRKLAGDGPAWNGALSAIHIPVSGCYSMVFEKNRVWLTGYDLGSIQEFKPLLLFNIAPSRWIRADARRALLWASFWKGLISLQERGEDTPRPVLPWKDNLKMIEKALQECDLYEQEEKWVALRERAEFEYPELYKVWYDSEYKSVEEREAWLAILKQYPWQERAWRPTWPDKVNK